MTLMGGLMIGRWEGELVPGSVESAEEHDLPYEPLDDLESFLPDRFPISIWEPDEGNVFYSFPTQDDDSGIKVAFIRAGSVSCTRRHRPGGPREGS